MITSNEININLDSTKKIDTNINDASFTVNVDGTNTIDVNLNSTDKINVDLNPDNFVQVSLTGGGTGPQGKTGPANVLKIGTVTKGDNASATITGTTPSQTLNLVLPKGDIGPIGLTGASIISADFNNNDIVFSKSDSTNVVLSNAKLQLKGNQGIQGDQGIQGIPGNDGDAATVSVGTTTTVEYNVPATVTNSGTTSAAILDFEIPKGKDGLGVPPGGTFNQVLAKLSDDLNDTTWIDIVGAVSSVNGKSGIVTLNADDIEDDYTINKFATGVNTGDETKETIETKLGMASQTSSGYLSQSDWELFNSKQSEMIPDVDYLTPQEAASVYVPFVGSTNDVYLGGSLDVTDMFSVNEETETISLLGLTFSIVNNQIWINKD